ncbi:neprilysin-1 [Aplysia californica]|uniref:Neprilysin-1 n=1 Tax=Aplysia californica TaxID=6500 RepID=A0ABM1W2P7_APLCA|nr:neprilysin-1 [Aplysia californica]
MDGQHKKRGLAWILQNVQRQLATKKDGGSSHVNLRVRHDTSRLVEKTSHKNKMSGAMKALLVVLLLALVAVVVLAVVIVLIKDDDDKEVINVTPDTNTGDKTDEEKLPKEKTMENRGDQHFKDWLKTIIGDSPLISPSWNEATFDLNDVLFNATDLGFSILVGVYPQVDDKNSSVHILKMDQPSLGMPGQKYYLVPRNDTMLMAYQTLIYKVTETLGFADPDTAQQDVTDLVDFEIQLAQISVPSEERWDPEALYNPMTLGEVHANYSSAELDMMQFVVALLHAPEVGITDVTENETIINVSPPYFRNFTELIRNTPKRTLANYVFWRVTGGYLETLTQTYRSLVFEYYKVVYGIQQGEPRDQVCARFAKGQIGFAIGKVFVDRYFEPEAKSMALDMIQGLQTAFDELVDELSWMDPETKRLAREKNDVIQSKIGYPEFVRNDTYLEEVYSNFTFTRYQYFENNVMIGKVSHDSLMRQLRQPVDTNAWFMTPATVNAYYYPVNNEIAFPAGILQPPFFSKDFPKSLNYGGIGMVIGHEITHGFDERGRQYDKTGNLEQWWSDSAIQKFINKTQCMVDQYSAYVMEEAGMNVSVLGGEKSTHYHKHTYNCRGKQRNSARVIGPNQNSEDFSRVFNCPKSSFMNAEKKCQVW